MRENTDLFGDASISGTVEFQPKKRYSSHEIKTVLAALHQAQLHGLVTSWDEGSQHVQVAYRGTGDPISHKWNVKVYRESQKGGAAIVCVDLFVLNQLVNTQDASFLHPDASKPVLVFDDAGWGFPLCGVMVGMSDGTTVRTDVVPLCYFQRDANIGFQTKRYLDEYARRGLALITATPVMPRVEICSGFINSRLKDQLRDVGFSVRVVEVTGPLQAQIEQRYREHVIQEVGRDLYYDPKEMAKEDIPKAYRSVVEWAKKNCPHMIKTGWAAFRR